jgi:hypothetical protein
MPRKVLVTVGTDGLSDWVQTPDGVKHMLGPISVLKFVTEVGVGGAHGARKTLDQFLKDGQSMLTVDEDRMQKLMKPHRARWTSVRELVQRPSKAVASSLIPHPDRTPSHNRQGTIMAIDTSVSDDSVKQAITNQVARIEAQIATLQTNAKEASPGSITEASKKKDIEALKDMIAFLRRPSVYGNQSDNSSYYGLPEKLPDGSSARSKEASVSEATKAARSILNLVGRTEAKIDQLVLSGKNFDARKAKADIYKIAKNVDIIVNHPKFKSADQEVAVALNQLGKRATEIHGLFASAKV